MNAAVASGDDAAAFAAGFDTAWMDFSKGLGAPVGAVLASSAERIERAWRWKQMFGGSMRQSGVLPPPACTPWTTTWIGWQRTTPTRVPWPRAWRPCPAWTSTPPPWRPTS